LRAFFFFIPDHTFYTNGRQSGTIVPRFGSLAECRSAIDEKQKQLEAIHKKQYANMLQNNASEVDALEKEYKATQQAIDSLKTGMGEVMGANVHGKSGNQLLGGTDDTLRSPGHGRPQFAASDTAAHVTGLDDKAEYPPEPQAPPQVEDIPAWEDKVEQDKQEAEKKAAEKALWKDSGYADFFRGQREEDAGVKANEKSKADKINKDITDTTVQSAIESAVDETGGYLLKKTEKGALEYVAEGIPYVGMVFDCFGQYFASEDAKTALLENYVNFGANLWNQQNDKEYRDALVWSPMSTFDCDQEFLDRALELQNELEIAGIAGYPDCTGMYWDDIVEDDRQTKEYNRQHPEDQKESKLDFLTTWVTNMSNPAFKDFTYEVYVPYGKIAVDSWITIYFGNWGMNE
jgi:hypothetical protein